MLFPFLLLFFFLLTLCFFDPSLAILRILGIQTLKIYASDETRTFDEVRGEFSLHCDGDTDPSYLALNFLWYFF